MVLKVIGSTPIEINIIVTVLQYSLFIYGLVVQLARTFALQARGHGFESHRGPQINFLNLRNYDTRGITTRGYQITR